MQNNIYLKITKRVVMFTVSLFFLLPVMSFAQCDYEINLDDFDITIWDASGTYDYSVAGVSMDFTLMQDSRGKITGYGNADILGNDISFDIKGTVKGSNNVVTIKFTLKGSGDYQGIKFTLSVSISGELNQNTGCMQGTINAKVCAQGECESETASYYECLPDGMNGNSDLCINVVPVDTKGKKLEGEGTLTLSNGDPYGFFVKGTYNSKKEESKFTLKGCDGASEGCTIKLKIDESSLGALPSSINSKILGQKSKYKP